MAHRARRLEEKLTEGGGGNDALGLHDKMAVQPEGLGLRQSLQEMDTGQALAGNGGARVVVEAVLGLAHAILVHVARCTEQGANTHTRTPHALRSSAALPPLPGLAHWRGVCKVLMDAVALDATLSQRHHAAA